MVVSAPQSAFFIPGQPVLGHELTPGRDRGQLNGCQVRTGLKQEAAQATMTLSAETMGQSQEQSQENLLLQVLQDPPWRW